MSTSASSPSEVLAFPELKAYWDATAAGRFVLPECTACGQVYWYPRAACPACGSKDIAWREASGRGSIYSYSVLRRASEPYVLAYIELEEGPRMLSNIVHCDIDTLFIGQQVKVIFEATSTGLHVPMFMPAEQ